VDADVVVLLLRVLLTTILAFLLSSLSGQFSTQVIVSVLSVFMEITIKSSSLSLSKRRKHCLKVKMCFQNSEVSDVTIKSWLLNPLRSF
jgi:hypothetical protein